MALKDSSKAIRRLMLGLAGMVLVVFAVASAQFPQPGRVWAPTVHLVLGVGVMPLIMAAMIYFTPVLTQSRAPARVVLLIPLLAWLAGAGAVTGMAWRRELLAWAAGLGVLACALLLAWMRRRARAMLGSPHPCLYWYAGALASLGLGLSAALAGTAWPEHWAALRRFHLHMNTLGFVGLTAVGTLQVLIPTAAGYQDRDARLRLRRDVGSVTAGALLVGVGVAWYAPLSWLGLVLWLVPLARFTLPLVTTHRAALWGWHGAASALAGAALGWGLVLVSGGLHGARWLEPEGTTQLFFFGFLFPLVTGAVSHLLPVWIWPERNSPRYQAACRRLALGSGARVLVFTAAGLLALAGVEGAAYLAVAGIGGFVIQIGWALRP